jgi:hypothetical protein
MDHSHNQNHTKETDNSELNPCKNGTILRHGATAVPYPYCIKK